MRYLKNGVVSSCLIIGIVLGILCGHEVFGQEGALSLSQLEAGRVAEEVAIPYVTALQTGDVQTLESLIDGKLAITLGSLLRDNKEYPNFLRESFGQNRLLDTKSVLEQKIVESFVALSNGQGVGTLTVEMEQSDNNRLNLQLSFEKDKTGAWKVVDQKVN